MPCARAKRFVVRFQYIQRRFKGRRCSHTHSYANVRKKKNGRVRKWKKKKVVKCIEKKSSDSKRVQIGSRSQMLSPLFINTNSAPSAVEVPELLPQTFCAISPEMIFEALRSLTLWRQEVGTYCILEFLKRNYPVNPCENGLLIEMKEKLRIATIVGFVIQTNEDLWCLNCALQKRKLTPNHVSLFWQAYADTLKALPRKDPEAPRQKVETQTTTTQGKPVFGDDVI